MTEERLPFAVLLTEAGDVADGSHLAARESTRPHRLFVGREHLLGLRGRTIWIQYQKSIKYRPCCPTMELLVSNGAYKRLVWFVLLLGQSEPTYTVNQRGHRWGDCAEVENCATHGGIYSPYRHCRQSDR